MHILFVCQANMCRSPLAEGLGRKLAGERSLSESILFRSSGLMAPPGMRALPEAVKIAAGYGVDLSTHETTPFTLNVADWADYLVAMTRAQKHEVIAHLPVLRPRVYTFAEFTREMTGRWPRWRDVPDPVGRSEAEFRKCARLLNDSLVSILDVMAGVRPRRRSLLERLRHSGE